MKKTTNFDAFAQFADAQLSKEEMKNIKGGGKDNQKWLCKFFKGSENPVLHSEVGFGSTEDAISNCDGGVGRDGVWCGGCEPVDKW